MDAMPSKSRSTTSECKLRYSLKLSREAMIVVGFLFCALNAVML